MKIIESKEATTLDGITLFCAEMSDGCTWFIVEDSNVVYTSIDDLENGGFTLSQVQKNKVFTTANPVQSQMQFVGHVNSFIEY